MWKWCWCYAIRRFVTGRDKALILVRSRHIKWIFHAMITDREKLKDIEIEESVPVGKKKDGWAGVWHALTSKWTVRKGKDE